MTDHTTLRTGSCDLQAGSCDSSGSLPDLLSSKVRQRRREEERERFGCGLVGVGVKGYRKPGPHLEKSCEINWRQKIRLRRWQGMGKETYYCIYNSRRKRDYLVNGASFPAYFVVEHNLIESQLSLDIQTAAKKKNIYIYIYIYI